MLSYYARIIFAYRTFIGPDLKSQEFALVCHFRPKKSVVPITISQSQYEQLADSSTVQSVSRYGTNGRSAAAPVRRPAAAPVPVHVRQPTQ
jgi:hypothetical protein